MIEKYNVCSCLLCVVALRTVINIHFILYEDKVKISHFSSVQVILFYND